MGPLKKTSFLFPLLLLFFVLLLYGKMFSYPYIQDDWIHLYYFSSTQDRMDFFDYVASFFADSDATFYRPLARLYFYFIVQTFGENAVGFRVMNLAMIFATAIVIKAISFRLLKNDTLAWFSGAWYAFSATILADPVMWMVGMYDLAGVFFSLLSLLLFLKNRRWASAFCYLTAILFKEGPIVLPFVLFLYAFLFENQPSSVWKKMRLSVQRLLPHLIGLLIYFVLRFESFLARVSAPDVSAYKIDFWGTHLLINILKYLVWTIEGLTGMANLNENRLSALLVLLIGITLSFVLWRSVWRNPTNRKIIILKFAENSRLILFLIVWGILFLLPVLFLPNHAYRYYMIYSIPAIMLILVLVFDLVCQFYVRKTAILSVALFVIYFSNFVTFNRILGQGLQAPVLAGSNALAQRGETVKLMLAYVGQELKETPDNTVFIFDGISPRTRLYQGIDSVAFRGRHFLRYVFGDPSIELIDLHGGFYGDSKRMNHLNPEKTVVLGMKEGKIKRYPLEDLDVRNSAFYSDR